MKNLIIATLLIIPVIAIAEENIDTQTQIGCDLARANAEVTATELADPYAFFLAGEPTQTQKLVAVGITESLSGLVRAGKVRGAAEAQCTALQSSTRLDQYTLFSTADIQKRGAIAALKIINSAIDLSKENISVLQDQLNGGVITIAELDQAEVALDGLEKQKALLLIQASVNIPNQQYGDISDLIHDYQVDQGKAAELTAKSQSHSGWDVSISVGENKPIGSQSGIGSSNSAEPFVTASVKYSFGTHASIRAAEEVGRDTALLLEHQVNGYAATLERHRQEVKALIDVEVGNIAVANRELVSLHRVRDPLAGVDSTPAANARRTLDIQIRAAESDLIGANVQLNEFRSLASKMHL